MRVVVVAFLCFTGFMFAEAKTSTSPTVAEAEKFMKRAEARLAELSVKVNQASWVHDNFITDDTEALAAAANDENTAATTELVEQATYAPTPTLPAQIKQIALDYGLMSSLTAFIAVDASGRTAGTEAITVPVAVPISEGVKYETAVEEK